MKPQCTTAAECLRELARVMEQFVINKSCSAVNSKYVKFDDEGYDDDTDYFTHPKSWSFAIAEVEGKPVFPGDELYCINEHSSIPNKFVPIKLDSRNNVLVDTDEWCISIDGLSWNPPKPKTVMVEMLVEDVEFWTGFGTGTLPNTSKYNSASNNFYNACKKALETK